MKSLTQCFTGIQSAIAELGDPETIWFRGHVSQHRLLPSLYRLSAAFDSERRFAGQDYERSFGSGAELRTSFDKLVAMHHAYVPTRLLAWTRHMHVALFCALVRESNYPAVFVLNPTALNTHSNIAGVLDVTANALSDHQPDDLTDLLSRIEHPLAVAEGRAHRENPAIDSIFTIHGRNRLPLEEQCSDCVRRVVLSDEEKSMATQYILSGNWMPRGK